ncbi:MAG TPA: hypothetical protein VI854_02145, partial [Acidimicrobiia bacterium]|nr:hypothetical protein [Acidimicrobiia bacterium]
VGVDTVAPPLPDTDPPATATAPPVTGPATTPVTGDEGPPVVLRGNGIGAFAFGAAVDPVIVGLTLRWGPPDSDSGWGPAASSPFGLCPGGEVRAVGWRGFDVLFSDGPTPHGPGGRRHFFTWEYRAASTDTPEPDPGGSRPPLQTEAGISVGSSVAQLQQAYGAKLELFEDEEGGGGSAFGVQLPDGGIYGFTTSNDPGGRVRSIIGGGGCGE